VRAPGCARRPHPTTRLFFPPCHLSLRVEPQRTMNERNPLTGKSGLGSLGPRASLGETGVVSLRGE